MKRSLYSAPDAFSVSPLLSLLPVRGQTGKLESLSSSLYARYEKVAALKQGSSGAGNRDVERRLNAEEGMLRQVLEWLKV